MTKEADRQFCAPLTDLRIGEARVFLGLEWKDGRDAMLRRAKAAREFLPSFGISHYCGYGRDTVEQMPELAGFGPTVQALSEETGIELNPLRFRANFYVEWATGGPFFEDSLVGRELRIGESVAIRIVKKDGRCVMINLDPDTAEASPAVLERVARHHEGCSGVYGAVLREGVVRMNDPVYLA